MEKGRRELLLPALMSVTVNLHLPLSPPSCPHRIFIFADPELLPEAICTALVTDTEAARVSQSPRGCMSCVVTHALQAALGDTCDIHGLRARLQVMQQLLRCFSNGPALAGHLGEAKGVLASAEPPQPLSAGLQPRQPRCWAGVELKHPSNGKQWLQQSQSLESLV